MRKRKGADIVSSMFFSASVAMIFTQVAGVVANIVDGVLASRYLGTDVYSAISLLGPFAGTLVLLAAFLSTGSQVVCSRLIGKGRQEEANKVFSAALVITFVLAFLLVSGCVIFPKQLISICGVSVRKNHEIYPEMLGYLRGYMIGIPALMAVQVLGPMVVMDGGKKLFTLSAVMLCLVDIVGDLLNVTVFRGGSFGMGLATSAAFLLQLVVLQMHYRNGNGYFRFSLRGIKMDELREVARAGSPTFVRKLATILRDLLINRMNLAIALSTAAVAARGVQNDLNILMFCIGLGVGKTLLSMTGIYYGVRDRKGLNRLFAAAMKTGIQLSGVACVICFFLARFIADFYTDDPEVIALSVFAIRCMAVSLILDTVLVAFQNYLQGTGNRKLVNIMNFGERLVIPVLTALVMGRFFGSRGIMASIAVSKGLLGILMFVLVCLHCHRFPRSWEDFMFLPAGFGGSEADSMDAELYTMEDVIRERDLAEQFCLRHGTGKKKALTMGLFVEEMAGNIIQHGKARRHGAVCVDYRLYVHDNRICLSLRDYCEAFDPTEYRGTDGNRIEPRGIPMVMGMAKEVRYYNTFNSNCLLLYLN